MTDGPKHPIPFKAHFLHIKVIEAHWRRHCILVWIEREFLCRKIWRYVPSNIVLMVAVVWKSIYLGLYEEFLVKFAPLIVLEMKTDIHKHQQMHMVFIWLCKSTQSTDFLTKIHPKQIFLRKRDSQSPSLRFSLTKFVSSLNNSQHIFRFFDIKLV